MAVNFLATNVTGSDLLNKPYQPYTLLPGSTGVVDGNERVWSDAAALFPEFNGTTNTLADTALNFNNATAADFLNWHSAHQVQYLSDPSLRTTLNVPADGDRPAFTTYYKDFGGEVFLLSEENRVIRLNSLTYAEMARLSINDQRAITSLPTYYSTIGAAMNLLPNTAADTDTVTEARASMVAIADNIITTIQNSVSPASLVSDAQRDTFLSVASAREELAHYFFTEQIELYKVKLENMAVFNPDEILADLKDIQDRYTRFDNYRSYEAEFPAYDASNPNAFATTGFTRNVNSSDGGGTVAAGVDVFLRSEALAYEMALQKAYVTATGTNMLVSFVVLKMFDSNAGSFLDYSTFLSEASQGIERNTNPQVLALRGSPLDGPSLLFILQNLSSQEGEAEADAKAEELNQSNKLLSDYSEMQNIINETLKKFSSSGTSTGETRTVLGVSSTSLLLTDSITDDHPNAYRIASMFDTSANVNNPGHPIEIEKSISRPTASMGNTTIPLTTAQTRTVWDGLATTMGESTKIISQDSQIRMDEIAAINKAKNRQFDLGSNTLQKLTDILRGITTF